MFMFLRRYAYPSFTTWEGSKKLAINLGGVTLTLLDGLSNHSSNTITWAVFMLIQSSNRDSHQTSRARIHDLEANIAQLRAAHPAALQVIAPANAPQGIENLGLHLGDGWHTCSTLLVWFNIFLASASAVLTGVANEDNEDRAKEGYPVGEFCKTGLCIATYFTSALAAVLSTFEENIKVTNLSLREGALQDEYLQLLNALIPPPPAAPAPGPVGAQDHQPQPAVVNAPAH